MRAGVFVSCSIGRLGAGRRGLTWKGLGRQSMLSRQGLRIVLAAALLVCVSAPRVAAQGAANATVFGTVKDAREE